MGRALKYIIYINYRYETTTSHWSVPVSFYSRFLRTHYRKNGRGKFVIDLQTPKVLGSNLYS